MIINKLNYEEFFVDYLDGKLNPSLIDELVLFLNQNPDIKNELDGIQETVLVAENTIFPNKSNLKKKSFLQNGIDNEFEYLCIASVEGIITQAESISLQDHIKKNQLKKNQLLAYQKIRINPNRAITFSEKHCLKRTPIIPIRYSNLRISISVAASIAIIVGVSTFGKLLISNNPYEESSNINIAELNTPLAKKPAKDNTNKSAFVYQETIKTKPEVKIINKNNFFAKEEKRARINIEESIPNRIHRIEFQGNSIEENQNEEVAKLAAKYALINQILVDQHYAQIDSSNYETSEVGVFEAIQYGVKSIGKLFGRDIKLDANKDKKGNIEKIIFESQLVAFSTHVNNNE